MSLYAVHNVSISIHRVDMDQKYGPVSLMSLCQYEEVTPRSRMLTASGEYVALPHKRRARRTGPSNMVNVSRAACIRRE